MKKLAFLLAAALALAALTGCRVIETPEPTAEWGEWNTAEHVQIDSRESDGWLFFIYSDRTASLAAVDPEKQTGKVVTVPSACRGLPVTAIEDGVFTGTDYEEVVLPDTVVSIGKRAFQRSSVRRVVLPDSVVSIGEECFDNCLLLESVAFGAGLKTVPKGAFYSCLSLKAIELPEGVEKIGEEAFASCRSVETVVLPSTLRTIGAYAFWRTGADGIEISVPEGASAGEHAFDR